MIKTIEKSWGQQVWLDDHRQIMLMDAKSQTSSHYHTYHHTQLHLLRGTAEVFVQGKFPMLLATGDSCSLPPGIEHRITSEDGCVLYERYITVSGTLLPEHDITRVAP